MYILAMLWCHQRGTRSVQWEQVSLQVQPKEKACLLCSLQGDVLNLHSIKHSLSLLCSDPDKCHQRGICNRRLWNAQHLSSTEEKLTETPASEPQWLPFYKHGSRDVHRPPILEISEVEYKITASMIKWISKYF